MATAEEVGLAGEEYLDEVPAQRRDGEVEVAFANRKQYVSLFVLRLDVVEAHRERLTGLSIGKGCIRYRRPEQVDMDVVRSMLAATAESAGPVCGPR